MAVSDAFAASGLTGATVGTRYVGATASGAPTFGVFAVGDFVIDRSGAIWVCTAAGQPGTWTVSTAASLPLAGGTMSGSIAMGSNKITGLTNGSGAQDAAAFGQVPVIGGTSFTTTGFGLSNSSTTVTANQLYLTTVYIPVACTLTGIAIENGATATGNVIVGLYNAAGSSQLAVSNSTGQSGPFHGQQIPFTGTVAVAAGTYIFASTFSSSSATIAVSINVAASSSTAQGGFSLPSTVTPPASMLVTSLVMMISY